jgi:hypothetical protein
MHNPIHFAVAIIAPGMAQTFNSATLFPVADGMVNLSMFG